MAARDTIVFMPAWNESENLEQVLPALAAALPEVDVLVVDDGSTDGTAEAARRLGAEVLSFTENRGLREAVPAGFRWAVEHGYRFVGRIDADGQHPPAELRKLLERVWQDEADVALGSRFLREGREGPVTYEPMPSNAVGIALLTLLMRVRLGQRITDSSSGMVAANRHAAELLADDYLFAAPEVEGLVRVKQERLRFTEVPVEMRQRHSGQSSFVGARAAKHVGAVLGAVLFAEALRRWHRRRS
jgi:glycosyltransferase involved in cell wall biosynthesis